jgi:hypothetical protein
MSFGAWLAVTSPIADQVPTVSIRADEMDVWQMDIAVPGLSLESFTMEGESFDRVSLPNEMMAGADGEAELPFISRLIALRTTGNPELEVVSEEWMDLEGSYDLSLDRESAQAKELAASYLVRDEYLPEVSFGVTPRQVMGGVSLAVVYVRAAKYNPAQQKIQVLKSAQLRVHETGLAASYSRPITETTASILRAVVPNWDEVSLDMEIVRGTLLYIMANNTTVPPEIQGLATWRTRKGYTVETAGPAQISSWTTSGIKGYIQGRYNSADPPLEFVCLLGDAGGSFNIPTYSVNYSVGDWNYSRLDGTDLLPDVALGRYCFDTIDELRVIVNKTYYYERDPASPSGGDSHPNWYKGGGCFAGPGGSGISIVYTMRWIRERMLEEGFTSSSIDTVYYTNESVTDAKITSSINAGVSVWSYRGYYHMEDYDQYDIANLHNGRRLPFMTTITCATNDFDQDSGIEDVCELLLKAGTLSAPKGVIAVIGTSSIYTHTRYNNCLVAGVAQGLLREGIHTTGGSLNRSKLELYVNYPVDSVDVAGFCHYESLLGDPAVDVFTDTPDTLFVNNPSSISVGSNTLTLTVTDGSQPVADAYVNLVKGTEVLKGDWTNSLGQVTSNFTATTAESLFVTATKHNFRPAIKYTLVTTSTRFVSPAYSTFTLDDDSIGESQGDGNGLANPGETIELAVPLKNWGTSTATGVSAVLSLTDPFVVGIGDNSETYGDIASGATVWPPDDFNFTLAAYAPDGHVLQFSLTVTDNLSNTWVSAVPISISNGNLEYAKHTLMGTGNEVLDPGESGQIWFHFANIGTRSTRAGIIAYLRSGDPAVVITDSIGTFSAATPGGSCKNEADPFGISATTYAIPGERVPLTCIFPLASGFADTILFTLPIGTIATTTPTPPDSYGYWAFDNTDLSYAKHPTYSWVEVDDRYGGAGTALSLTDASDEADKTVIVNLPFTFKYYGQSFTQICVCSNGWLAMGADQFMHTFFRNWTIPGALGPDRMIAPFWDDLRVNNSTGRVYTYHDAANHRFIIEWSRVFKYNGSTNPSETFECILYQPGYPTTPTGDGEILFQYMTCTNTYDVSTSNDYATVGIENSNHSDGVLYSYWNIAGPGAASMTSGRAILFTTQRVPPTTPKAPTNLTTLCSGSDIQLRWNGVREDILDQPITIGEYKIYRYTSPFFTPEAGNYLGAVSDTTYLDVGATGGGAYFYVVQAYTSGSLSPNGEDNEGANAVTRPEQGWIPRQLDER